MQDIQFKCKNNFIYCEGSQALEQAAQASLQVFKSQLGRAPSSLLQGLGHLELPSSLNHL